MTIIFRYPPWILRSPMLTACGYSDMKSRTTPATQKGGAEVGKK